MDILEHPLEAVAFHLYSLPDASAASGAAAWTCLAAVLAAAAAAGLWRLRSSTPPAAATATLKPLDLGKYSTKEVTSEAKKASSPARSSPDRAAPSTTTAAAAAAPSPKERYTAYYHRGTGRVGCCDVDDDEGGDEEEVVEAEEQYEDDVDGGVYHTRETRSPFGWEVVRSLPLSPTGSLPLSPMGMGRYRSPTALSGSSVVRLWDEAVDAGVAASPRRGSRVVGTVSAF